MVETAVDQSKERAAALVNKLWNSADLGPALRKTAKEMFPDISLPEESPAISPLAKQLETLEAKLAERDARDRKREEEEQEARTFRDLENAVNKAVAKFGLNDEGRSAMLDRMKETKNFTDPDAAAAYIAHSTKPATSAGPSWAKSTQRNDFYGTATPSEVYKKLHTDPEGYLEDELHTFARDPDKYVQETFSGRAA